MPTAAATYYSGGIITAQGDTDWFRVYLEAGVSYHFEVEGGDYYPLSIDILEADGSPIQNSPRFVGDVTFTPTHSGAYWLSIADHSPYYVNFSYSLFGGEVADAIRGDVGTTAVLAVGGAVSINDAQGVIAPDWYGIDVVAGQSYLLSGTGGAFRTYVSDANGQLVAIEASGAAVHFTAAYSGRYYAGVDYAGSSYGLSLAAVADDRGETPATAGSLLVGSSVTGLWESYGDDDWYAVTLQAGASYSFSVSGSGNSANRDHVQIFAADGSMLASSYALSGANNSTVFAPLTTGTYYVSASVVETGATTTTQANYQLSAVRLNNDLSDNVLTTGNLAIGGTLTSAFNGSGDDDWIAVQLVAGQSYQFNLSASNSSAELRLFDATGQFLSTNRSPENPSMSALTYTATQSGTFFLGVEAPTATSGSYSVAAVSYTDAIADNAQTTAHIAVGGMATGSWEAAGDRDWFAVDLVGGERYAFGLTGGAGKAVSVRDADGNLLSARDEYGEVQFQPIVSGTYYVQALGQSGNYQVQVVTRSAWYDDYDSGFSPSTEYGVLRVTRNGSAAAETITADAIYEIIDAKGGDDIVIASAGFDRYLGGDGIDLVSFASFASGVNITSSFAWSGSLTAIGLQAFENFEGSRFDDQISGSSSNNILSGGDGNDTLEGGLGDDTLLGGSGSDTASFSRASAGITASLSLTEPQATGVGMDTLSDIENLSGSSMTDKLIGNSRANVLSGQLGDDQLNGLGGRDMLLGGGGNDRLDGGADADRLEGGLGDDLYIVDNVGDQVIEANDAGEDFVESSVSISVAGQSVETIRLVGTAAINATGSGIANHLIGNGGANVLNGGAGADLLEGGGGNDRYIVDDISDLVVEASGGGNDTVEASVTYSLAGREVETLKLTGTTAVDGFGNQLNNTMLGNGQANWLDGAGGADTMQGGLGDDHYVVDHAGDKVIELANGGSDTVDSSVTFTLAGQYSEALNLTGSAAINGTGNSLTNRIIGNAAANILNGGDGNDRLDGGAGGDRMIGGLGNDTFVVDQRADMIVELDGQGLDTVEAWISYSLAGQFVETLKLMGSDDLNGTGNGQANSILGNAGANMLNGMGGADDMRGGAGNDRYVVDNASDKVTELVDEGLDIVEASVSFTIAGQSVEQLVLTGSTDINGSGNSLNNVMIGNGGANTLSGSTGDDAIHGGLGSDLLNGGAGLDQFWFETKLGASNVDRIADFKSVDDTIYLGRSIFAGIASDGALTADAFRLGTTAQDADDRIIYDKATGNLFYDADGSGSAAAVLFAQVTANTVLTAADFFAVA